MSKTIKKGFKIINTRACRNHDCVIVKNYLSLNKVSNIPATESLIQPERIPNLVGIWKTKVAHINWRKRKTKK